MPSHIQRRLQDPGAFLPHGWSAVLVDAFKSSRLSRELDCVLYTVDWGMKGARQGVPASGYFPFFFLVFIPHLL